MAGRLFPALTLAAALAACSTSSPAAGSTITPGPSNASLADTGTTVPRGPGGRGGPGGVGRGEQALLRGITLSADQQQRIDTIRARHREQMQRMRQEGGGDREAMRTQMRTMMEKQQAELRAELTPEQQRQFDQNVAEMRARMERGGGRPGGAPPL